MVWRNPRLAGRVPELDGVRGLAILLVVLYHYFGRLLHPAAGSWQYYLLSPLRIGWSGVDLFFVLSGFLIGGILTDAKNATNYYQTFYTRRVYRIFPLYFLYFAVFVGGLKSGVLTDSFKGAMPIWSYAVFLQNFFVAHRQTFGAEWMAMTWSLAVEEQFYLLLPFAIRRLGPAAILRTMLGAIVLAPVLRVVLVLSGNRLVGPVTLLPCRMDALALGVLVAMACRNQPAWIWLADHRRHFQILLVALGLGIVPLSFRDTGRLMATAGFTWIPVFFTVLLILVVTAPVSKFFGHPALVRLGTIAYGLYMVHMGVDQIAHGLAFGQLPALHGWASVGVTLLALIGALLLAALSWKVLEGPLVRRARALFRYRREEATDSQPVLC